MAWVDSDFHCLTISDRQKLVGQLDNIVRARVDDEHAHDHILNSTSSEKKVACSIMLKYD